MKIVLYEQIAAAPVTEFKALFSFLGLRVPSDFEGVVRRFSETGGSDNPYETRRISKEQIGKWKDNLSSASVSEVMRGYFRSDLQYYRDQLPPAADPLRERV
ncbi:MAG: hypothetical protein HY784_02620 [Chloroflexi bacterium]|nr:hypothetical protein [Chloroflexota bacterium]